ncbi:MAG: hypothetical protein AAF902_18110 [Chloroflexota bacterium]
MHLLGATLKPPPLAVVVYWIDSERTGIFYEDIGARLGLMSVVIDLVEVLDSDRLVLATRLTDTPIFIYNISTNRIERRFGIQSDYNEIGTTDRIDENSFDVGPDGILYWVNTYQEDQTYLEEIQLFDAEGNFVKEIQFGHNIQALTVRKDGHLFIITDRDVLQEFDADGNLMSELERDPFRTVNDMAFGNSGSLYLAKSFGEWFMEVQPDQEFGFISEEAGEFGLESWDLGETSFVRKMVVLPNEYQFVFIDGSYRHQRLFLFEPNR